MLTLLRTVSSISKRAAWRDGKAKPRKRLGAEPSAARASKPLWNLRAASQVKRQGAREELDAKELLSPVGMAPRFPSDFLAHFRLGVRLGRPFELRLAKRAAQCIRHTVVLGDDMGLATIDTFAANRISDHNDLAFFSISIECAASRDGKFKPRKAPCREEHSCDMARVAARGLCKRRSTSQPRHEIKPQQGGARVGPSGNDRRLARGRRARLGRRLFLPPSPRNARGRP